MKLEILIFLLILITSCKRTQSKNQGLIIHDTILIEGKTDFNLKKHNNNLNLCRLSGEESTDFFYDYAINYKCTESNSEYFISDKLPSLFIYNCIKSNSYKFKKSVIILLLKVYKCELICCHQPYDLNDYLPYNEGLVVRYFSEFSNIQGEEVFLSSQVYQWLEKNKEYLEDSNIKELYEEVKKMTGSSIYKLEEN